MWDRFGQFGSADEINRAAAAQKAEGDEEALVALALENGLDREDAEDYMDGATDKLCTQMGAALGKLRVEAEHLDLKNEFGELYEEIVTVLMSNDKRDLIKWGIMRKDRSLAGYLAKVIDKGYEKAVTPHHEILDKVTAIPQQYRSQMKTGIPNRADRMAIMLEYYGTGVSQ